MNVNVIRGFCYLRKKRGIGFGRVGKNKAGLIAGPPDDIRKSA